MLKNAAALRKSAPWPPNLSDSCVSCIAPATQNASLQILFKCPTAANAFETATKNFHVLLPFDKVHNPLRLPRGPKVVGDRQFLTLLCFTPQLRALFQHLIFQKCSDVGVLCTFWLGNVLRVTASCTFSTPQLPKVLRTWCALHILTSKCASRHNGVQFFISHLPRWFRTCRFNEPTFWPSGATKLWKNTVFRDFPTFPPRQSASSFFWLFRFSDLLSSALLFADSSHLCLFICPYCRKFDF